MAAPAGGWTHLPTGASLQLSPLQGTAITVEFRLPNGRTLVQRVDAQTQSVSLVKDSKGDYHVEINSVPPAMKMPKRPAYRQPKTAAGTTPKAPSGGPVRRATRGQGPGFKSSSSAPDRPMQRAVVEVFYATDRKSTGGSAPTKAYGSAWGDASLRYGICEVSIPHDHRMGRLESPSIWRFEFRSDPEKHVVLLKFAEQDRDGFLAGLSAQVRAAAGKQLFVFVHGFNVTFSDAARRTAQIAYDLQFDGAAAFYSWPSKGSKLGYTYDENSAEWTKPHFISFLEELSRDSGAEQIHLIAHSMGNRVLAAALQEIAWKLAAQPNAPRFSEVILTAPDIDAEVFRNLAVAMRPTARRMTLYASSKDEALKLSHRVHGYPRAGDIHPEIVIVDGLDSIDASTVDTSFLGHSYFADNRSVISDIYHLIRNSLPPGKRGLRSRESRTGQFWAFAP
jgi:esterase/lipase superfamily enzyme